jgi:4-hydroxy-3-methylbut-2-enyl diphosphate reductase
MSRPLRVEVAEPAGACYGVDRALRMIEAALESDKPVCTFGPLIHNPQVIAELEARGVRVIDDGAKLKPGSLAGSVVVIRTHGVPPDTLRQIGESGAQIVDATCPYVAKAQQKAAKLAATCDYVVIVGDDGHPEVEGLKGYAGPSAVVMNGAADVPSHPGNGAITETVPLIAIRGTVPVIGPRDGSKAQVGIVVQTTQTAQTLAAVASCFDHPKIANTICNATSERQEAALELAGQVDVMLVVGGRNSGNTQRLAAICKEVCAHTYLVEAAGEVQDNWIAGADRVGITAGASTPIAQIEQVRAAVAASSTSASVAPSPAPTPSSPGLSGGSISERQEV